MALLSCSDTSYYCAAVTDRLRGGLSVVTRVAAIISASAAAALTVYCILLVYAAATFEHGSLPGPAVLSIVAVAVGLAAVLCAGVAHLLWRWSNRTAAEGQLTRKVESP